MWDDSWEGQDTLRRGAAAGRESKAAPISLERVAPRLKDGWGLRRSGGCGEEHAYNCASNMRGLRQRDGGAVWQALSPPLAHPLDYKELPWVRT